MSLHASFVLIEGDHRRAVERLLSELGYSFAVVPRTAPSFSAASKVLFQWQVGKSVVKKAVGLVRGWTSLYDPERHLAAEPYALRKLASHSRSRVFSMVCDATSGAFGFALVRGGLARAWFCNASGIVIDEGAPVPEEEGFCHDHPCEDDVLHVMERVAYPRSALDEPGPWAILTLEAAEAEQAQEAGASGAGGRDYGSAGKRRWWRFW